MSSVSLCPVLPNLPATPSASPSDEGVPSNAVVCLFPGLIQGGAWTKKEEYSPKQDCSSVDGAWTC